MTNIERVFALILAMFVSHPMIASGPIIELAFDDSVYLQRQPIWVTVRMVNTMSEPVRYTYFMFEDGTVKVILRDSNGYQYAYNGEIASHGIFREKSLQPKDTLEITKNLLDFYGIREEGGILWNYLPRGYYKAYACVMINDTTTYSSDTIIFKVDEPRGDEKVAHDLIVKARKAETIDGDYKTAIGYFDEVLDRFPHSRYAEGVLYDECHITVYRDGQVHQRKLGEMFEKFPNSRFSEVLVEAESHSKELLREVSEKYPNTRIGRKAEELLKVKDK